MIGNQVLISVSLHSVELKKRYKQKKIAPRIYPSKSCVHNIRVVRKYNKIRLDCKKLGTFSPFNIFQSFCHVKSYFTRIRIEYGDSTVFYIPQHRANPVPSCCNRLFWGSWWFHPGSSWRPQHGHIGYHECSRHLSLTHIDQGPGLAGYLTLIKNKKNIVRPHILHLLSINRLPCNK